MSTTIVDSVDLSDVSGVKWSYLVTQVDDEGNDSLRVASPNN